MARDELDGSGGTSGRGRRRGRATPKGRQLDDEALAEVRALLGQRPRRRDLLIEHLHLIQDAHGHLAARHLRALAEEMRLPMAELWEVASFYAHFDLVREGEAPPPAVTIRVCDSLSCEMAGAGALRAALVAGTDPAAVRVLRAPCMGRCDTAPVCEVGHRHVDHATPERVAEVVASGDPHARIPDHEGLEAYRAAGGYDTLLRLRREGGLGGGAAVAARLGAQGPRRRWIPGREEVGLRAGRDGAAIPRRQRRRGRAGDVQRTATISNACRTCSWRGC